MIHYGAPRCLEDYMQESGRAEEITNSLCPEFTGNLLRPLNYADQTVHRNVELKGVRDYLENTELCRRFILLWYFDPVVAMSLEPRDKELCCDNCRSHSQCAQPQYNAPLDFFSIQCM